MTLRFRQDEISPRPVEGTLFKTSDVIFLKYIKYCENSVLSLYHSGLFIRLLCHKAEIGAFYEPLQSVRI